MILNRENVIEYLTSKDFSNCEIVQIRNLRNFCAIMKTNRGRIVIKQAGQNIGLFSFISLDAELKFYNNDIKNINDLIPKVFCIDSENSIVIIEYLSEFKVQSVYDDSNFFQSNLIGRSLALIHQSNILNDQNVNTHNYFRVFDIITPEAYNAGGRLFPKCIELMQRFPDLNESLIKLEQEFIWDCFIHGDLKSDNFLITDTAVKFIDWELSGIGDRYIDIGAIIGNYILYWIETMRFDEHNQENDNRLVLIKKHIFLFLSNYVQNIEDSNFKISYEKIVKFAGVFLLNVFYSKSVFKSEYSKQDIMILEYGRKMLVFPHKFTIELFLKNIIEQNAKAFN